MMKNSFRTLCKIGRSVISKEIQGLEQLLEKIDENFAIACEYLLNCKGKVVVTGMGKSGHVGKKIAATFASTGTPAFFLHPAEAGHGDLGMLSSQDVVLAISFTGNTQETVALLPVIKRYQIPLISITGKKNSTLAEAADIHLYIGNVKEACPHNLVPTTSTTLCMVLGDALAIALLNIRNFTKEDFALRHPSGTLGKRLLWRVNDIMRTGDAIPKVSKETLLSDAIIEITQKNLGMTGIVDKENKVLGIFVDGDLRRTLNKGYDINKTPIGDVMICPCTTVSPDILVTEIIPLMEKKHIKDFLVVDKNQKLIGAFNIHDLYRTGIL